MVYHSNIKEYQNNIVDNPSSDSNVNMSEVNSQPTVSADNSPAPAPAPAPAPVPARTSAAVAAPVDNDEDLAQNAREDELEVEASVRIENLKNAIRQEEK